ncbi:hypothetical protein GQ457_07G045740 [Hibiscus cannabinus]
MKFAPKAPPRRAPKLEVKAELAEDTDAAQAGRDLLERLNVHVFPYLYCHFSSFDFLVMLCYSHFISFILFSQKISAKTKPKFEKKVASSQVAFGFGAASAASSLKIFGGISKGKGPTSGLRDEKEYKDHGFMLNLQLQSFFEEEFASANIAFDESSVEPAVELGLLEENPEATMFFMQLPPTLPVTKQTENISGKEINTGSKPAASVGSGKKTCGLEEIPAGLMGKMLVYKSGAVKLKLGDTLYDVTPGSNNSFSQDVVAVNAAEKHCCVVGELEKRVVF